MNGGADGREDGFALLETVVAFAILAVALSVSMQTISQSARVFVRSEDMEAAGRILDRIMVRELPLLAEAGTVENAPGSTDLWRIEAEPIRDGHSRPLLAVMVTIWPRGAEGPHYTYQTLTSGTQRE